METSSNVSALNAFVLNTRFEDKWIPAELITIKFQNSVHFAQQFLEDQRNDFNFNNSAAADGDTIANSHGLKESKLIQIVFQCSLLQLI